MAYLRLLATVLLFFGTGLCASGQADTRQRHVTKLKGGGELVEVLPQFIEGETRLRSILIDSLIYPPLALSEKIGGEVIVRFTVDSLGGLVDINIKKGVRADVDSEAVRVVKLLQGWRPGLQNEQAVNVVFTMPINFFPDGKSYRRYQARKRMEKNK